TRPEGLGGSRDAGPATAGPRPPYVTEAVRGGYGTATPYSGYGRTGRTGHTATATANALVATVPLLLLLSLSNALFGPIFSAAFFVLWSSVLFFPPSSSYGRPYNLQRRQEQAEYGYELRAAVTTAVTTAVITGIIAAYERTYGRTVPTPPTVVTFVLVFVFFSSGSFFFFFSSGSFPPPFPAESFVVLFVFSFLRPYPPPTTFSRKGNSAVLTEDLPWPAAKIALLRYYGAFNQIRTVSFYDKLRRHEARRPKTKDTIDWLEKHAFLCRKVGPGPGPGPGPNKSTEHSYGTRPEGLGGSRDAGPATAGPRPPYVTEAVRHSGYTRRLRHGYAVQRLRPYGPYGPYEGRNVG
ncbi:hypothetical protein L249_6949, partial [Ophiocordyceps polyrhachis-furcata BCC 54312]